MNENHENQIRKLKGKLSTHRDLPEPTTMTMTTTSQPMTMTTQQIVEHIFSKALTSTQEMENKFNETVKGEEEDKWVSRTVKELTNCQTRQVLKMESRPTGPEKKNTLKSRRIAEMTENETAFLKADHEESTRIEISDGNKYKNDDNNKKKNEALLKRTMNELVEAQRAFFPQDLTGTYHNRSQTYKKQCGPMLKGRRL